MADAALYCLVWEQDRVDEALSSVSRELKFLWGTFKLSMQAQARLAELGFADIDIFTHMEDDVAAVRAFALEALGFKPDVGSLAKATVSRLISAWQSAAKRG